VFQVLALLRALLRQFAIARVHCNPSRELSVNLQHPIYHD
jgi:hypothetical protein